MKRWLVILVVILALVILISPGIVGRLAEENIADSIAWTESDSPGLTIETETFKRGWFTSEGRHRVDFEEGQFQQASEIFAAATGSDSLPSLIIDTRLDHGLLPVTSLSRDQGSLAPGLASTVSTFQIDRGDGDVIEIPGALYSNVGLAGASDARLLLDPAKFDLDGAVIEWQGADLNVHTDSGARKRSVEGAVQSISLAAEGINAGIESFAIDADQSATPYGFNLGSADITLTDLVFGADDTAISIDSVAVKANTEIEDERVSGSTMLSVNTLTGPTGDVHIDLQMSFSDFDAASLGVISAALREAQGAADPQTALMGVFPAIESEVQTLLQKGVEFNVDQLEVSLPQGVLITSMAIDVPETDPSDNFSWPGVILSMTASIDVRIPVALFDMVAMMSPEASSLVAMGILQKDGTDYVMDADYAKGLVNVNGAPMPLPIPGL